MEIILATSNREKLTEFSQLFANTEFEIVPQSKFNVPEALETGLTFIENALIKARNACEYTNKPVIADDSGIVVDALEGAPGVHSARYANKNATYKENRDFLLKNLKNIPAEKRTARFHCVLVYMRFSCDPMPIVCEGTWEGIILDQEHGDNGFGYDPVFFVPTHNCSAAELPFEVKNEISHRGMALRKMISFLIP